MSHNHFQQYDSTDDIVIKKNEVDEFFYHKGNIFIIFELFINKINCMFFLLLILHILFLNFTWIYN